MNASDTKGLGCLQHLGGKSKYEQQQNLQVTVTGSFLSGIRKTVEIQSGFLFDKSQA